MSTVDLKAELMVMAQALDLFTRAFTTLLAASVTGQLEPVAEPPKTRRPRVFKPGELRRCVLAVVEAHAPLSFDELFAVVQRDYPTAHKKSVRTRLLQLVDAGELRDVPGQPGVYQRAAQRPQLSILP